MKKGTTTKTKLEKNSKEFSPYSTVIVYKNYGNLKCSQSSISIHYYLLGGYIFTSK